ncbi:MAG: TlpA family protein disulfide reductase [Gammaproteobacteria bacterium]|nr:TlpA family protein disulfide reductase [Gammaproteobacteria bacterium]
MLSRIILIALIVVVIPFASKASENPDYQLQDLHGNLHRVSDNRGKWLIINFWATWCAPCIKEMPELESFYQNNKAIAHIWGVTFEDTDKAKILEYVKRLGVSYPILGYGQDPLTGFGNVTVLPTTFVIDPNGLFFHRFEGPITAQDITQIIER